MHLTLFLSLKFQPLSCKINVALILISTIELQGKVPMVALQNDWEVQICGKFLNYNPLNFPRLQGKPEKSR